MIADLVEAENDLKSLSRERFGRLAEGYVTSKSHAKGADLDRFVEFAQPQPDWVALDVATGGGHTALRLAPHVARVVATDLTPAMLLAAQAHIAAQGIAHVAFGCADAECLPFPARTFDLVTCRIALHHFPNASRFVHQAARVLKRCGLLLVQDHVLPDDDTAARYVDDFERLRDPSHNRAFNEAEWRAMFEDAGLTVERAEEFIKHHKVLAWAERQGCTTNAIKRLVTMLREAPLGVAAWLQARDIESPKATFVNHHIIIAGRKR